MLTPRGCNSRAGALTIQNAGRETVTARVVLMDGHFGKAVRVQQLAQCRALIIADLENTPPPAFSTMTASSNRAR